MDELRDASAIKDDPEAMGARLEQDGYLFFRGLIDRASIMEVRRKALEVLERHRWLDPSAPLDEARPAPPDRWTYSPEFLPGYKDVLRLEAVHRLAHHPALEQLFGVLIGETAFAVPSKVVRIIYPGRSSLQVRPHKDHAPTQIPDMLISWFPLGDCPRPMGGLAVLRGSQYLPISSDDNEVYNPDDPWLTTDYEAGDVLVVHCLTTHVGRENSSGQLRLSMDARWTSTGVPLPDFMTLPDRYGTKCAWEDLSEHWSTQRWREIPPEATVVATVQPSVKVRHADSRWLRLDPAREAITIKREPFDRDKPWYGAEAIPR